MNLTPCNYAKRAIAYIVDFLFVVVPFFVCLIVSLIMITEKAVRPLSFVLVIASFIWLIGAGIWNNVFRQSKTGQTFGKSRQNIQLVNAKTGLTPGIGIIFIRFIVSYPLNALTFGLFTLVDFLFPAFDKQKQRVVDKICSTMVIDVNQTNPSNLFSTGTSWSAPTKQLPNDPLN